MGKFEKDDHTQTSPTMAENNKSNPNPRPHPNIKSEPLSQFLWNAENPKSSIEALLTYVEREADKAMAWYWQKKSSKAKLSRMIQFSAVVLTASGAIIPVLVNILKMFATLPQNLDTGLFASLMVGLAAALIGIDRAFGYSSGWARYVLTATSMRKSLEEFRMDWTALYANSSSTPSKEQLADLIVRAKEFIVGVQTMVLQETKDWVTEFQNSLAQLDKETSAQLDTLKTQVEKASQVKAVAEQPGSVELTVSNADKTDGFTFAVVMEDSRAKVKEETTAGGKKWVCLGLAPGHYKATVVAMVSGKQTRTVAALIVKPQEVASAEVSLPV
jgi:hypothetical protein